MSDLIVSIIMPAFNSSKTIRDSINSVISQTYQNWELLVINDCSSDNTAEIVSEYADGRIKLIDKKKNEGVALARNSGLDLAGGDYVAFLDSDDRWLPNKLELQLDLIKKNDVDVVFGSYYRFNDSGILNMVIVPEGIKTYHDLIKGNFIGNLTGLYNFKKFNKVRQKKIGAEDFLFWLEIFADTQVKGLGVKEPIAYYRVAEKGKSLSGNKFKSAIWTWNIYYNHLKLGLFKSLYCFGFYIYHALMKRVK